MFTRIRHGIKNGLYNYDVFVIDGEDDIADLPTTTAAGHSQGGSFEPCCAGSKAFVTDQRKMYMLNNDGEWKIMVNYAAGGGGGGTATIEVEDDGEGNVSIL